MASVFPKYTNEQNVFCFNCGLRITGPIQASGHAKGHGAWRGQCTGQDGCQKITWFDLETPPTSVEGR